MPSSIVTIHRRRVARRNAGIVGLLGFVLMGVSLLDDSSNDASAWVLPLTWSCMGLVYGLSHVWGRLAPSSSVERARRLAWASLFFPVASLCLLLPISLHGVVAVLLEASAEGFVKWMKISAVLSGLAHLLLLGCCVRYARSAVELPSNAKFGLQFGSMTYLATVVAGHIPGFILFFVPPVLIAVTGLFIIPLFGFIDRKFRKEEFLLRSFHRLQVEPQPCTALNGLLRTGTSEDVDAMLTLAAERKWPLDLKLLLGLLFRNEQSALLAVEHVLNHKTNGKRALAHYIPDVTPKVRHAIVKGIQSDTDPSTIMQMGRVAGGEFADGPATRHLARQALLRARALSPKKRGRLSLTSAAEELGAVSITPSSGALSPKPTATSSTARIC